MKILTRILPLVLLTPMVASAFLNLNEPTIIARNIGNFINGVLIPSIFVLGTLFFMWGMFLTFIKGGSDESAVEKGKNILMYSIFGFVAMISLWGLVRFFSGILDVGNTQQTITVPRGPSF